MTTILITLAALIALFVAVIALRRLWRAFLDLLDREIDTEMDNLRRCGFFDERRRGAKR